MVHRSLESCWGLLKGWRTLLYIEIGPSEYGKPSVSSWNSSDNFSCHKPDLRSKVLKMFAPPLTLCHGDRALSANGIRSLNFWWSTHTHFGPGLLVINTTGDGILPRRYVWFYEPSLLHFFNRIILQALPTSPDITAGYFWSMSRIISRLYRSCTSYSCSPP